MNCSLTIDAQFSHFETLNWYLFSEDEEDRIDTRHYIQARREATWAHYN
jgi:hypothetical protein